jgi:hypothetical protein
MGDAESRLKLYNTYRRGLCAVEKEHEMFSIHMVLPFHNICMNYCELGK